MPSVWDRPNEQNRMIRVNGVLRTTLTYVVPSQLSVGTGDIRIAASAVPRISAPTAEYTVNWIVVQNASKIWPRYSVKISTWTPPVPCQSLLFVARLLLHGRRRRRRDARRSEILLEGGLPCAVLLHLRDGVVDLGLQFGVALLQADAVLLLREGLADDLERAGALRRVAGEDHLIGGHRVDGAVLQCLHAGRVGVVLLQLHPGILVLDALRRRRAG